MLRLGVVLMLVLFSLGGCKSISRDRSEARQVPRVARDSDSAKARLGWVNLEMPLVVAHDELIGLASAEGFWESTESGKDRQLISPITAKITCERQQMICREVDASVFIGVLQPDLLEYSVSTWNRSGIVADNTDEGSCGIGHRLSIDFKSNSVVVTDYPKKMSKDDDLCRAFQNAGSSALHGGSIVLAPAAE